ncbi:tyrosine-type recombinase/integrase [Streptomyces niveus]|uniref:tyrosine-type recombinase/integrase n=1 Tax=Streptomyces niveus TaxID=193462 RepID=UPI0036D3FD0B
MGRTRSPRCWLSKVRSKSTASHAQQHLHGLAKVSDTLRARPDRGMDKSGLSRADIENFLNRMAFLDANGRFTTNTRISYVRMARNVLKQCRVMGLTRPEGPMAGLPDDFVITRLDVPKAPEPSEEGQDLPPDVMRQLCAHLDSFEAMTCLEIRLSVELLMDTGRRPDEICRLELNCLTRDSQGKPVLLYNNWKEQRIGRQLPIHEPTAKLITEQQKRVRERFPDRPPSSLVLLPAQNLNLRGDRSVDSNHLSAMHREWVEKLPDFVLDDGTVFDKEKIFPYIYRHSFAQRHADAGVPVDVLADRTQAVTCGAFALRAHRSTRPATSRRPGGCPGSGSPTEPALRDPHRARQRHRPAAVPAPPRRRPLTGQNTPTAPTRPSRIMWCRSCPAAGRAGRGVRRR